jgi:allophanate hydrolase
MLGWTIDDWRRAFTDGASPEELLNALLDGSPTDDCAWISLTNKEQLKNQLVVANEKREAAKRQGQDLPLYGVPFAVKDNIDVLGLPTTAACPGFAYQPKANAFVVQKLIDAGAIVIGKTNLDQFATGLCGVRSPYGAVPNAFDPAYVSGGSSSGSASVVARGLVPFALGSDTAGSVRVPAGLNNIIGFKTTRGAWSTTGTVPASRTLDCVSVLTTTVEDACIIDDIVAGYDAEDAYSRQPPLGRVAPQWPAHPRFGVPASPDFCGDSQTQAAYESALKKLESFGVILVPLDFAVFDAANALFYKDAFVGERYAALEEVAAKKPEAILPLILEIISAAKQYSAADAFRAIYKQAELKRQADTIMATIDALLVPTAPVHLKIADVEADPIKLNSLMSRYSNFCNLLDFSALALPAGFRTDGLPFGITLMGPAFAERKLCEFGSRFETYLDLPRGALALRRLSA